MATYAELKSAQRDSTQRLKVEIAITVMAEEIMSGDDGIAPYSQLPDAATAHANRTSWLRDNNAFVPDDALVQQFWNAMLALNESVALSGILAADDADVLTNVKQVVDILAGNDT